MASACPPPRGDSLRGAPSELILFGGTFDPPHVGHRICVQAVLDAFPSAEIWVMPTPEPPLAGGGLKGVRTPFAERLKMAQLAFGDMGERIVVSDWESRLPAPHYTYATLEALHEQYPGAELRLVIGSDQAAQLDRWKYPERILALAELIVIPRGEGKGTISVEPHPASSTKIRDSLIADWLPASVLRYVLETKLYSFGEETQSGK